MKSACRSNLLHTLSCVFAGLLLTFAAGLTTRAQESQPQATVEPPASPTGKFDEYGKIGHCDMSARLDNFAITLQNQPNTKGYLMIYLGEKDLPARLPGVLARAVDYLVNSRGVEPERLQVVSAGYRKEQTTELWLVAEGDDAPTPTDTIEVSRVPGAAYQWDERGFSVDLHPDSEPDEIQVGENEDDGSSSEEDDGSLSEEDDGSASENEPSVETVDEAEATEIAETEEEAAWRLEQEKYELSVESRELIEVEGSEEPPTMGTVKVSLWWQVESFVKALKDEPEARACLIYYDGAGAVGKAKVSELVSRAKSRLEEMYGIKSEQLVLINGGRSDDPGVELWIVPNGAALPEPQPSKETKRNGEVGRLDGVGE
ncbi:MAG: hypothetical protein H0T60_18350 [Acidobacteria bacterium]|nr:hypothetical protein [Acidobacteriota bacterium]